LLPAFLKFKLKELARDEAVKLSHGRSSSKFELEERSLVAAAKAAAALSG
jgi:hypothetical protein